MARRLKPGDILQLRTSAAYGYAQFVGRHPFYGDTIVVCPATHAEPQVPAREVISRGYHTFYPATTAVDKGLAEVVGRVEPVASVPTRIKRFGPLSGWVIEDGGSETVKRSLTVLERQLPIGEIVSHDVLLQRIATEWRPEDETDAPDYTTGGDSSWQGLSPDELGGANQRVSHYLYFPTKRAAREARAEIDAAGFRTTAPASATDSEWLVLVHEPERESAVFDQTEALLEDIARKFGGEYDGRETEVGLELPNGAGPGSDEAAG